MSNYNLLLKRLFAVNQANKVKLGLEMPRKLHEAAGCPADSFRSIHIAGTNGKGSVAIKMAGALIDAGYTVGLYTSPHIATFRERIRVNGVMISEKEVEEILGDLFGLGLDATFFELTTMLAFQYFRRKGVDFAVIETGLGGRLDATNVITPVLSIITSIGMDHTSILGDTLDAIAREKAGIIKKNVPVVIGPNVPIRPIHAVADALQSPVQRVEGSFDSVEEENIHIARRALESLAVNSASIERGLQKRLPCRFELFPHKLTGVDVIMDVAHNPPGFEALFKSIKIKYPHLPIICVVGISSGKDLRNTLSFVAEHCEGVHLVEAGNGRAAPVEELDAAFSQFSFKGEKLRHQAIFDGIAAALKSAQAKGALLVVCGSFFIMAEARRALGIIEPADAVDMNEQFTLPASP